MTSKNNMAAVAKSDDGSIQITFTIPQSEIEKGKVDALKELSTSVNVPGFRPGKAPESEVEKHVDEQKLLEKVLSGILPKLFADAIKEHALRPAIYPKFEVISAEKDKDWQIRAVTCEVPDIDLSGYKEKVTGALRANKIWVPGKDDNKKAEETMEQRAQKESEVIKVLLDSIKVGLPKILIDDEVNARLSRLLERIEKLGLSLDSYLASIGKNAANLRSEYETQAKDAINLDLILTKIADVEKLIVDKADVDNAIKVGQADPKLEKEGDAPERRALIEGILKRRKALDFVMNLS